MARMGNIGSALVARQPRAAGGMEAGDGCRIEPAADHKPSTRPLRLGDGTGCALSTPPGNAARKAGAHF